MILLNIGLDNTVLDKNSILAAKTREYASLVDRYIMIVPHNRDTQIDLSKKLKVYGVGGCCRVVKLLKIYILAKLIIKKYHCDVISTQDPFELGLIGWRLACKFKIGWNAQEHGDFFSQQYWRNESTINYFRYYLGKFLIKRADSVRVVSQRIEEYLSNILRINKDGIVVVPVLTEVDNALENHRNEGEKTEDFVFLNLGRFVKQKNLSLLLRAFAKVIRKNKNVKLKLIGKGLLEAGLRKEFANLELEEYVEMNDWVSDAWQEYKKADAYVLSSNYEGWGRVIVEAVAVGLPIVMTDTGCAGELIENEISGLLVPVGDEEKLAEAMLRIVGDKELRKSLAGKAQEALKKLPDKQETLRLYRKSWEIAVK